MHGIVSILPKGEGFSSSSFGAIALCVRDFTLNSRYREHITVIGGVPGEGFANLRYAAMSPGAWYCNRTRAYAAAAADFIKKKHIALAEVHNRPRLLHLIADKADCKLALHLHNDPQEMDAARTARERGRLLERCAAVYCVSEYIRGRFLDGMDKAAGEKAHAVYNGIDIPAVLPHKEKLIAFAGRMTEGKGALLLAEALRLSLPEMEGWKTVFIGSRRHSASVKLTDYERKVAQTLEPLGEKAVMPGFLSHEETLAFYARSAIAVVPSVWEEPFGRTAIEAMSHGAALISSGRGGLKEVTGDAAVTLASLDAATLARELVQLAGNEDIRLDMQRRGRERARQFAIAERTQVLDDLRQGILMGAG